MCVHTQTGRPYAEFALTCSFRFGPNIAEQANWLLFVKENSAQFTGKPRELTGHNAASADIVTGTQKTATHTQQQQQQQQEQQGQQPSKTQVTRIARTNIRLITWAIETHAAFPDAKIKMLGKNRKFEKISDELYHLTEFYRNPAHKFPKSMEFH